MNFKIVYKIFRRKLIGRLNDAIKDGLVAGENVTCMSGVNFGSEPYLITLGDRVRISTDVLFVNHDGGTHVFRQNPDKKHIVKYGKISVGNDTFIGARAVIMPGVKIGSNCVIGAGSVVTHDVPDNAVYAGVPARFLFSIDEYEKRLVEKMPPDFDYEYYSKDKRKYLQDLL